MVQVVGRVVAPGSQIEPLQDVQGLEHLERGERRRHRDDLPPAIGGGERRAPLRPERGQILLGEPAARLAHRARHRARDRAAVERLRPALRHLAERGGQLLVGDDLARPRAPVAQVEPLGLRRAAELRARLLEERHVGERERDPVLGEIDGGPQHRLARHRAEALVGREPAAQVAGRRASLGAAGQLVLGAPGRIGGERCGPEEVQHVALAGPRPRDQHEPDAARARHEGLHHVQGGRHRDRGVHRVAPLEKHADARHRGERVRRCDGAAGSHDRRAVGLAMRRHAGSSGDSGWRRPTALEGSRAQW